jgi:serine protease Do
LTNINGLIQRNRQTDEQVIGCLDTISEAARRLAGHGDATFYAYSRCGNGVNTAIFSPSGGSVGIAFAAGRPPPSRSRRGLKERGVVTRGWIGVQIQQVTPEIADGLGLKQAHGALVAEPQADGPAARAGVESGDVITAVNGKDISDARELARTISGMPPGAPARLTVVRKGKEKTFNVTLGTLPDQSEAKATAETPRERGTTLPQLGLTIAPRAGGDGVVVSNVDP